MTWVIRFPSNEVDSYYQRYTKKGPVFTFIRTEAFRFPMKVFAENVLQGDTRLKSGVVEDYYAKDL